MQQKNNNIVSLHLERQYWDVGILTVAGVDEVGMGALAGPVVAGAVVFSHANTNLIQQAAADKIAIRDSKTLSVRQREVAAAWIHLHAESLAVGEATVAEISQLNIRAAAHLAMRRAIDALSTPPATLLIDGGAAQPHPDIPATTIVGGDRLVFSIAAASIVAKVHRDQIMADLDTQFPVYGFAHHKGYGSARHLAALQAHGPCAHHRPTYAPIAALLAP